jgi:predicted DNA-binding transcriptional regulator AlpA
VTDANRVESGRVVSLLEQVVGGVEGLRTDLQKALELLATQSKCRDAVEPTAAHDPLQLLTAAEVAGLLRIDPRTLRSLRHERSFPRPVQVGRSLRWRRSAVERYLRGAEA